MKVIFNVYNVGLSNNGGSRTLIRTAETMANLGIDVGFFGNHQNKYNWHKIDSKVKFSYGKKPPVSDILIATGYGSVKNTLESRAKKRLYFIRGLELWVTSENNLIQSFKSLKCIVNSQWLFNYMLKNRINSYLIYPGLDFDHYSNLNLKRENCFGALYHERHKTKRHEDAISIENKYNLKAKLLNRDIRNPGVKELNKWYNTIPVWFAPTELEGLHNPPMESSLAGCGLVCNDFERNGMLDYAIHEETAMVYPARNLDVAFYYIDELIKNENKRNTLNMNMIDILKTKIGCRASNVKKMLGIFNEQ